LASSARPPATSRSDARTLRSPRHAWRMRQAQRARAARPHVARKAGRHRHRRCTRRSLLATDPSSRASPSVSAHQRRSLRSLRWAVRRAPRRGGHRCSSGCGARSSRRVSRQMAKRCRVCRAALPPWGHRPSPRGVRRLASLPRCTCDLTHASRACALGKRWASCWRETPHAHGEASKTLALSLGDDLVGVAGSQNRNLLSLRALTVTRSIDASLSIMTKKNRPK